MRLLAWESNIWMTWFRLLSHWVDWEGELMRVGRTEVVAEPDANNEGDVGKGSTRTALVQSWSANRHTCVKLFTAGSAIMKNVPMYLEHGGSAKRASISSSNHWYSIASAGCCTAEVDVHYDWSLVSGELSDGSPWRPGLLEWWSKGAVGPGQGPATMKYNPWSRTGMMNIGADRAETHLGPLSSISTRQVSLNGHRTLFYFYGI